MNKGSVGFVGLGRMGGGMCRNLAGAGFDVLAFDKSVEALAKAVARRAVAASGIAEIMRACDTVHFCLHGDVMLPLLRAEIQPALRAGQIVVDHATLGAPDARRLAAELASAGAVYLDVAISGGSARAEAGTLRMFAGGDERAFRTVLPHLRAMADPEKIIYGGGPGQGQVMKVMQQLQGRLLNMARMEIIAYGRRQGFSFDEILAILDLERGSDDGFVKMVEGIEGGDDELNTCLYPEWKYYLAETAEKGIPMPMLEGANAYYSRGAVQHRDIIGRPSVSLWKELMR